MSNEAWEPQIAPSNRPERPVVRFSVGLTIATIIAMAILIGLGVWQLQRLKWKEALLADVARAQAAQPVPIEPVLDSLANGHDVDFTRVRVTCRGLGWAPSLNLYSISDGKTGSRLISACPVLTALYRTVLVDRGFVADTVSGRPAVDPNAPDPVEIVGVLRTPENGNFMTPKARPGQWFLHDASGMGRALKAPVVAPVFLMAETSSNPDWKGLVPAPLPVEIANNHFEYALTWFGLAASLACVYVADLIRRRKS